MIFKKLLFLILTTCFLQACTPDDRRNSKIPPTIIQKMDVRLKAALDFLSSAIRSNPAVAENYYKRALVYQQISLKNEALEDIEEAISLKPNIGKYLYVKALIYRDLKRFKEAYTLAQQARNFEYSSPELYILSGELAYLNNDFNKSNEFLAKSLQETPYNGDAYFYKSMLEARKSDTLTAIELMKKSIEYKPRNLLAYINLAQFHSKTNDYTSAKQIIANGNKYFEDDINLSKALVDLYKSRGFLDSSFAVNEKILIKYPNDIQTLATGIYILSKWKNYFKSIEYCDKMMKIEPQNADYVYLMGTLNEAIGNKLKAEENYEAAIQLKPSLNAAYARLAKIRYSINAELGISMPIPKMPKPVAVPVYEEPKKVLDTNRVKVNIIAPKAKMKIKIDSNRFKNN
jgi:tetratricopeptide (TPR) repeat protein